MFHARFFCNNNKQDKTEETQALRGPQQQETFPAKQQYRRQDVSSRRFPTQLPSPLLDSSSILAFSRRIQSLLLLLLHLPRGLLLLPTLARSRLSNVA